MSFSEVKLAKLATLIEQSDVLNPGLGLESVRGISVSKVFIDSRANMTDVDVTNYKLVTNNEFAYVPVTSRNGNKISIALNQGNQILVSRTYIVFRVKNTSELLPEFLMLWLSRNEFDRYARFHSWGSARETFDWDAMCEVEIPLPSLKEQQEIVAVTANAAANRKSIEMSQPYLEKVIESVLERELKETKKVAIGPYISQSERTNEGLGIDKVRGISVSKELITSVANMTGVEISGYKVLGKGEFGYVPDTSRRGDKIALALNNSEDYLISKVYTVFSVINPEVLLPEYLMIWLRRNEFDRYARFHSWGSARETFDWDAMCEVEIPLPSIDRQRSIVNVLKSLETRRENGRRLKQLESKIAPVFFSNYRSRVVTGA